MAVRPILRSSIASLAYFGVVFAAGFALGTLRVLILIPRLGENKAVLLELPIILALSWMACRWLIARFDVPTTALDRLVMGGLAFAVLMLAEFGVSVFGLDRSLSEHLEHYRHVPAALGLAGQIAFAAFPVVQSLMDPRQRADLPESLTRLLETHAD